MLDLLSTSVGLLPERIDLTHVLAVYGAGAILGELVALLAGLLLFCTMFVYVMHPRASERGEYEQLAREHGLAYPPPPRKRLLRR
jgi:hypothetical protein